ncbi:M10 family metallopeptidase C-terminal domain-containing protein [Thalassovita sp.]|uniref:M10 family metallopeptidase C-terminal domain-containing protein n=1 Tax=Thalassovita sp. TaxID=1979401 RepID=UPI002B278C43|nr:M10 family metallopeptidase C-terminal domain-containing protein [Thalassovita sp.]
MTQQGVAPEDMPERIDAVQWPTFYDTYHTTAAPPLQISYSFQNDRPDDLRETSWTDVGGWGTYTEAERDAVRAGLREYERVLNVQFVETLDENAVDITFLRASYGLSGGRGRFQYDSWPSLEYDGFVVFNTDRDLTQPSEINLILHEIGHAFSLKHPGNYDVNPLNAPPGPYLPEEEDNYQFTVMSYTPNPDLGQEPESLMLYDIAALQERWGGNQSFHTGNNTYVLREDGNLYVIWDAGGTDTLTAGASTTAAVLDLREGRFSELGHASGGVQARIAVAYGVDIENAIGTAGNDLVEGNDLANRLEGLDGNDTLNGRGGDDSLTGGDGLDSLIGGDGNDTIMGGETAADRHDAVFGGTGDDYIDGGYGNDELRGDDGQDTLIGGFGADTVIGANGDDNLTAQAWGDILYGGAGNDFLNGGFGYDQANGGDGADRFFHLGIADHGSDWIQDYSAADGDVLQFGRTGTRDQFQVNFVETDGAGGAGVEEAFVIYRPTGQIIWALVDGAAQSEITLWLNGVEYDLMA